MRTRIKMVIGRDGVPSWVRPEFARRISLADRLYPVDPDPPFPTIVQRDIYRTVTSGLSTLVTEEEDRTAAEFGVETRHPFADRRVMEFGMAIPEELRWRGGTRKFVLREAMRAHLPAEVGRRLTSADASDVFVQPLRELFAEGLFARPAIERCGWVDMTRVRRFYDDLLARHANGDESFGDRVWPLWLIAGVELWLQEVVERQAGEEDSWREMLISV